MNDRGDPMSETTETGWREFFPRGVLDPFGPSDEPIFTSTDRRLLWHIESGRDEKRLAEAGAIIAEIKALKAEWDALAIIDNGEEPS